MADAHWACYHFSQSNPLGPGPDSVTDLLRRVAESIERLGPECEVQDLLIRSELNHAHGELRWVATVYYHLSSDKLAPGEE